MLCIKQRQRRNVRAQRHNIPEGLFANVATLKSNVATFQRVVPTDVATLQRGVQNRDCQRRDIGIKRRDMTEA